MTTLEEGLRDHILGVPDVAALVDGRVYADEAPQEVGDPFIVYQRISTVPTRAVQRVVAVRARMQIECWGTKKTDVLALANALRASFRGRGQLGQLDVIDAIADDERSDRNAVFQLYRQSIDVFVTHKQ